MPHTFTTCRVAVVQAAPRPFEREATLDKMCHLVSESAAAGAQLILFPEAFVPAYPRGLGFGTVVGSRSAEGRRLWERYWANAIPVPSEHTDVMGEAARAANAYLVIGVIEQDAPPGIVPSPTGAGGTLYCTLLYFGPDGRLLGKHRKLKPTGSERLIWGEGDGSTLTVLSGTQPFLQNLL